MYQPQQYDQPPQQYDQPPQQYSPPPQQYNPPPQQYNPPAQQQQVVFQAPSTTTTTIINAESGQWQTGLCDICAAGCGFFCYACNFLHCAFASARTHYDRSNFCFNLCFGSPCMLYNIVREGYGIQGDCCSDIFTVWCCPLCAAIRMEGEVLKRGSKNKPVVVVTQR